MKAIAKCPKCGENLTTDCEGCIRGKSAVHNCGGEDEWDAIENVDTLFYEIVR